VTLAQGRHEVVELLGQVGGACCSACAKVERELRRLLPLKTRAEYEPDDVTPGMATRALERAQRCVAVARAVAAGST
jgi:hypothetical protein